MVCQYSLDKLGRVLVGMSISLVLSSSGVWSGFACLENPCFHGICIDYLDINSSHQCYCRNGFTGWSCQINWDECRSNPCLNGGLCSDGIASFNCSCPDNFAGALCEYDLSACEEVFPCQNNGTCTVDPSSSNGTFMCVCPPGFSGPQCESDVSICNQTENVCSNGGRCVDGLGMSFHCDCESGWSGRTCEVEVDECQSQPCQNGGICVDKVSDFSCACPFGYTGKSCESKLKICDENPCLNGAFCLYEDVDGAKLTCYCVPDYHGTLCELKYDDCDPSPKCFNGGTCVDGVGDFSCSCPPSFFGPTCECSLDNMTNPVCLVNETLIIPSVSELPLDVSRGLEASPTIFYSSFQLSTTLVPTSSLLIHGEDLTSSHAKPLGSALVISTSSSLVMQSEVYSLWSSLVMEVSSVEPFSPPENSAYSTKTPILPRETVVVFHSPVSSSPILSSPSVLIENSESGEVVLSSEPQSLLVTHSVNQDLKSGEVTSSPILPVLTISEVIFQTPSVSVVGEVSSSPVVFSEGPVSSSVASDVPEKDVGSVGVPVIEEFSLTVPQEASSSGVLMNTVNPSLIIVSSDKPESVVSDYYTRSPTDNVFVTTYTLEPSGEIEQTASSVWTSPSPTISFDVVSSEMVSALPSASPGGLEESGGVSFTPALHSTQVVSQLIPPDLLTPPLLTSTSSIRTSPSPTFLLQTTLLLSPSSALELGGTSSSPTLPYLTTEETPTEDSCGDGGAYCHNGAKCISTSIQPSCICTFKFTGDRCETQRDKFRRASFSGDSFIGYRVPNESVNRIEVGAKVATNFPDGILLYTSVDKLYALIFLQDGHVTLHFSCGDQSMHFVETHTKVDNGYNFTVEFNMELVVRGASELHCVGQVNVNNSYVMRGEQTLSLLGSHDNPMQTVYLGGVPPSSNAIRNDDLIGIMPGFRGCLYKLSVNGEEKDLFDDAVEAQEVSDCSAFECATNPCYGVAKCVPSNGYPFWQCVCPPGFVGVRCQIRVCDMNNPCQNGATCTYPVEMEETFSNSSTPSLSPLCLCPLGFSGRLCQSKINITKPSFKPTLGFDYSAFIAYEPIPRFVDWAQLKFHFVTPNATQVALLFYSGFHEGLSNDESSDNDNYSDLMKDSLPEESPHLVDSFEFQSSSSEVAGNKRKIADFFALTFVHGYITLTWNLGSGTQRIITPAKVDRRLNVHTLFAGRSGRQAWLKVDGMRNVSGKSPGPFHRLNVNSELYVGGHEAIRFEGLPHDLPLHKGFHGCIFDFGFRVKNRLYLPRATRGRNVQNCYEEDC